MRRLAAETGAQDQGFVIPRGRLENHTSASMDDTSGKEDRLLAENTCLEASAGSAGSRLIPSLRGLAGCSQHATHRGAGPAHVLAERVREAFSFASPQ